MAHAFEKQEFERDPSTNPLYYLGGELGKIDTARVAKINDLKWQRDRSLSALLYSMEICGLYEDAHQALRTRTEIKEELIVLQENYGAKSTESTHNKIQELTARLRGLSGIILLNRGVENDSRRAQGVYLSKYFENRPGQKPILDLDKIIDLYDTTDEIADKSPLISAVRSMEGLDSDTRQEAERIGRILLLTERQEA